MAVNPFALYDEPDVKDASVSKTKQSLSIDSLPTHNENTSQADALTHPSSRFSAKGLLLFLTALFLIIIIRLTYLQIIKGSDYRSLAEGNRINTTIQKALRGVLYDRDGNLLVKNIPNFTLVLQPGEIPRGLSDDEYTQYIQRIQDLSQLAQTEFYDLYISSLTSHRDMILRNHIPYEEALQLMIHVQDVPGVEIQTLNAREYLAGDEYGHILGYTSKISEEEYDALKNDDYLFTDNIGKTGVEKSHESTLRGIDGRIHAEIDSKGAEQSIISETEPVAGKNITLTIDSDLQRYLYEQLQAVVENEKLSGGSAVAIDPRDGSIRALVSYPSFNSNVFSGGISTDDYAALAENERNPLFHRAISGEYPSGSTFKPVVAAAGVQEGLITASTTVNSVGGIQIDRFFFPDWKAGGHGVTNLSKALAESVNTFFYLIGGGDNETTSGLGVERITDYASKFSFGDKTGIDLPGERSGFLPSKAWKEEYKDEPWYIGDTYHLAIGQGDILVTPLQIAVMTSIFANKGTLYIPHIAASITTQDGESTTTIEGEAKTEHVVNANAIAMVRDGLREAVLSGSARSLLSLPVTSAGKTGTAQFGAEDKTHSWFTAFAPYEAPELVITVLVEEGGGGNDSALPIARNALQRYFSE